MLQQVYTHRCPSCVRCNLCLAYCSQERTQTKNDQKWLDKAIKEAYAHRKRMRTVLGCRDDEFLQVHIFSLYCLGTVKRAVLDDIKAALDQLTGLVVIFYPFIPKKNHCMNADGFMDVDADAAAIGAETISDGSDVDPDTHDFDSNGVLPEAITSVYAVRSAAQRAAQLAKDCNQVDNIIGMANIDARFPKALTFDHRTDSTGDQTATRALVLIPVESGFGVVHNKLEQTVMFKSGNYLQVPVPTHFIKISKKLSMQAKRAMTDHYTFDSSVCEQQGQRFAASKVSRGQMGIPAHEIWMKDIITHCGMKAVMFCDYAHGSSEIQCAAINCKVSPEAIAANVRVLSWAHDPRRVFADIGMARGRSLVAKLYLGGKLVLPGHVPIPPPGEPTKKSRKLINSMLEKPLAILSMTTDGNLIIPSDDTIKKFCPVEIAQKYTDDLKEWREKFPAPPVQSNSAIGENKAEDADKTKGDDDKTTATGDDKAKDDDNNDKKITVGTTLSPEELDSYGEKIVKEGTFPDGTPNSLQSLRLVLATAKNGKSRVWLHNVGKKDARHMRLSLR